MKWLNKTIDLHAELLSARERQTTEAQLLDAISALFEADSRQRLGIRSYIASSNNSCNNQFKFDLLATDRIFHIGQIRAICIDYRLRFLPSGYFKDGIPEEAITKIKHLQAEHGTNLDGFAIVAPTKAFRLRNFNDPLLFAPIGNGYFYLIHKWGNDLNSWRKLWVWPYRNLSTFTTVTVLLSLIATWLTPESNLSRKIPMADVIVFLFAFKSIFAVGLYCFFMLGKKFNSDIWDSVYFND
ncbi:hypothetical protein [Flavobacterium selenitireducens]|uniref:hypothetical protein n=1 Tax=Flavobacterium selenitireducens TaxID=2722704 RepID=UPI00168AA8BE|nr:hypothetical protein [Flavobacterium selenitireducens]MBD3581039.1 hypothetical protein [Flavobacterium selenitireducens]